MVNLQKKVGDKLYGLKNGVSTLFVVKMQSDISCELATG